MNLWIARDKNGELYIYCNKPELDKIAKIFYATSDDVDPCQIDEVFYPEVTYENSPKKLLVNIERKVPSIF